MTTEVATRHACGNKSGNSNSKQSTQSHVSINSVCISLRLQLHKDHHVGLNGAQGDQETNRKVIFFV